MKYLVLDFNGTSSQIFMEPCQKCWYDIYYQCTSGTWSLSGTPVKYTEATPEDRPLSGWTQLGLGVANYVQIIEECEEDYDLPGEPPYFCNYIDGSTCADGYLLSLPSGYVESDCTVYPLSGYPAGTYYKITSQWDSTQIMVYRDDPYDLTSYMSPASALLSTTITSSLFDNASCSGTVIVSSNVYTDEMAIGVTFPDNAGDIWQTTIYSSELGFDNLNDVVYNGTFGTCPSDSTFEGGVTTLGILNDCPVSCENCADMYLVTFSQDKTSECWADNEVSYDMYYPLQIDSSTNSDFGLNGLSVVVSRDDSSCVWSASATINETAYTYLNNMCAGDPNNTASANYNVTIQLYCDETKWVVEVQDLGFKYVSNFMTQQPDLTNYSGGVTVT